MATLERPGDEAAAEAADPVAEYVRRVVDAAPPLTPEQRDRLALLLRRGTSSAGTAA